MIGATLCSGIGAPEAAAPDIEWAWCAEVDKAASAVLAHHYPHSTNLGDIMADDFIETAQVITPELDLLVAGTPCQAFSVAGNRQSLNDARGNLTLRFVEIVHALKPRYVLWENVPGVLSTKDNAFGCFLGALVGAHDAIIPKRGWTSSGLVFGPERTAAWATRDAQYYGVAQRRERVFVVSSIGKGTDPQEILLKWEGLPRHTAPSREEGQRTTGTLAARTSGGGGLGTDFDLSGGYSLSPPLTATGRGIDRAGESRGQDCVIPVIESSTGEISHCLNAGGMGRIDYETETMVTHSLRGGGAFDASEDGTGRGTPLIACRNPNS